MAENPGSPRFGPTVTGLCCDAGSQDTTESASLSCAEPDLLCQHCPSSCRTRRAFVSGHSPESVGFAEGLSRTCAERSRPELSCLHYDFGLAYHWGPSSTRYPHLTVREEQ